MHFLVLLAFEHPHFLGHLYVPFKGHDVALKIRVIFPRTQNQGLVLLVLYPDSNVGRKLNLHLDNRQITLVISLLNHVFES